MHDLAEAEGQVGQDVSRGHYLENRKLGHRCQGMRRQVERRGAGPCAL